MPKLKERMQFNPDTHPAFNKYLTGNSFGAMFGAIGGGLIGWPVGNVFGGGSPNWALAGAGLASVFVGLNIQGGANKRQIEVVDIYNDGISAMSRTRMIFKCKFAIDENGLGFILIS